MPSLSLPSRSLALVLFSCTYAVAATLGQWTTHAPLLTAILWAPSGLTLAVLLMADHEQWWKFAAVGYFVDFIIGVTAYDFSLQAGSIVALGNILEPLTGATLVRWWCGMPFRFNRIRDVLAVAGLAAIPSTMISATLGAATLAATGVQEFASAWLLWWIGDAVGVLIVAPLTFVVVRDVGRLKHISLATVAEAGILLALLFVTSQLVFTGRFPFAFIIIPPLIWSALRFGMQGAAIAMAVLAAMLFGYVTSGFEPFATHAFTAYDRTIIVQAFLATVAVSTQLLGALIEQRDGALRDLHQLATSLEARIKAKTAALRESEERQRLALSAGKFGHWQLDLVSMELLSSDQCKANLAAHRMNHSLTRCSLRLFILTTVSGWRQP